jgi:hypothetical protein
MEDTMSALIDLISLLAILANVLFALHIWSGLSARAERLSRGH